MDKYFIAGKFFDHEIPLDKKYLLKYFTSDIQIQFLKYYLVFNNHENFVDHTGIYCTFVWVKKMRKNIDILIAAHAKAKRDIDLKFLMEIESGAYKL